MTSVPLPQTLASIRPSSKLLSHFFLNVNTDLPMNTSLVVHVFSDTVSMFSLLWFILDTYFHWYIFSILEEQSYVLRDAEAEVLFCFSLEESLKRAQVTPLFKVLPFIKGAQCCDPSR